MTTTPFAIGEEVLLPEDQCSGFILSKALRAEAGDWIVTREDGVGVARYESEMEKLPRAEARSERTL